jgi:type I restriction enzyme M protein
MITGEIKNQIDQIWDTFWVGGITISMSVLEQMTYLFFLKMLDDDQMKKEASTIILVDSISNPTFKDES